MARKNDLKATKQQKDAAALKPGSSADDAKAVGGEGDFGAPVGTERTADRDYVSRNTKMSDPGAAQPFDWEQDGVRDHGVGGRAGGPGSASGGDIDPDVVGVGTGGSGIATSGVIGRPPGPDDSDGTSDEFAAGGHAEGRNQGRDMVGKVGGAKRVRGSTVTGADDVSTLGAGQGADAATNPAARGDDSFAGEVSTNEAQGQDDGLSPSSDTQGLSREDNQGPKDEG